MAERLKAQTQQAADLGSAPGGRTPFGYDRVLEPGKRTSRYEINPTEAEALRFMAQRVREGASMLRIGRELDARGVTTREGRPWHGSSVRASLLNPAVAGLRVHRREVAGPGNWAPIFDRATWEDLRATLADPRRKRTRPPREYVLSGLVETTTGDRMVGRMDRGAGGEFNHRSYATRHPSVTSMAVGADALEELVVGMLFATLADARFVSTDEPAPSGAGALVAQLEQELSDVAAMRGAGDISMAEWQSHRKGILARLEEARAAIPARKAPAKAKRLLDEPGGVERAWPDLDLADRRDVLAAVIERIVIGPADRGRWTTIEERVGLHVTEDGQAEWRGPGRIVWRG